MPNRDQSVPDTSESASDTTDDEEVLGVLDLLKLWYHYPILAAFAMLMYRIRTLSASNYIKDGTVYLAGNDAWYHLRTVKWTVQHYPQTIPFDVWTRFPQGTSVGQFGTLYDQLLATAALIIGLGSPTDHLIRLVLLYAPAVFGALLIFPVYKVTQLISDRRGGLLAAITIAVIPGTFLQRTLVGFADHNAAEPFFMTIAVGVILIALREATTHKPIWELIEDRAYDELRPVTIPSVLAGLAIALYIMVWPPGLIILAVLAAFLTLRLTGGVVREGATPEPVAYMGAVTALSTAAFLLPSALLSPKLASFSTLSMMHVGAAFLTACGAVFLAWLNRVFPDDVSRWAYPGVVAVLGVGGWVAFTVVAPEKFVHSLVVHVSSTVGFGVSGGRATIAEARSLLAMTYPQYGFPITSLLARYYGFAYATAAFGFLAVVYRSIRRRATAREQFAAVWLVTVTLMGFTQVRYNYYLAAGVAVFTGYFLYRCLVTLTSWFENVSVTDLEPGFDADYRALIVVFAVAALVITPMLVPVTIGGTANRPIKSSPAPATAAQNHPGDITKWDSALTFLREDTPKEGTYGGANNAMSMSDTHQYTDDYAYPAGSYGVMSWWDYGHWITVQGNRIPVANPFQEYANAAAHYLLAPSEEAANKKLATLSKNDDPAAKVRYVMIDWKMVNPSAKFTAPTVFHDNATASDFVNPVYMQQNQTFRKGFTYRTQRYYESMMVRLYHFHGSAIMPQPVAVDWTERAVNGRSIRTYSGDGQTVKMFKNMSAARSYAESNPTATVGGIGAAVHEKVDALEHYRLVNTTRETAFSNRQFARQIQTAVFSTKFPGMTWTKMSWVKTFERVPGATIHGTAPPNTVVKASVKMTEHEGARANFTYVQYAKTGPDGEFTMTVPYSTTGYENWGPKNGYTDVSVTAAGPYKFRVVGSDLGTLDTAQVTEAQVIGESNKTTSVTATVNGAASKNKTAEN